MTDNKRWFRSSQSFSLRQRVVNQVFHLRIIRGRAVGFFPHLSRRAGFRRSLGYFKSKIQWNPSLMWADWFWGTSVSLVLSLCADSGILPKLCNYALLSKLCNYTLQTLLHCKIVLLRKVTPRASNLIVIREGHETCRTQRGMGDRRRRFGQCLFWSTLKQMPGD